MPHTALTISPATGHDMRTMWSGKTGQAVSSWLPPVRFTMTSGTIYYDTESDLPIPKLQRLATKYQTVHGKLPIAILIEQGFFESLSSAEVASLPYQVKRYRYVLPNHFWMIGEDEFIQHRSESEEQST